MVDLLLFKVYWLFLLDGEKFAQARNDNVRLPGSPYTALDTIRGRSAGPG